LKRTGPWSTSRKSGKRLQRKSKGEGEDSGEDGLGLKDPEEVGKGPMVATREKKSRRAHGGGSKKKRYQGIKREGEAPEFTWVYSQGAKSFYDQMNS